MASPKHSKDYVAVDMHIPVLHRVATQVRVRGGQVEEVRNQIYEPVLVSLGPYYHGHPQLKQVEHLKDEILGLLVPDDRQKQHLLTDIQSRSHQIRTFYGGLPEVNDVVLAKMMLRDACFLIYCLDKMASLEDSFVLHRLGMSRLAFVVRDFFMLENQLPYFLLKILIPFTCPGVTDKSVDTVFYNMVSSMIYCGDRDSYTEIPPHIPRGKEITDHLLDACRTVLVGSEKKQSTEAETEEKKKKKKKVVNSQFRSVRDLKEKGIHFRPTKSKSRFLTDIEFRSHSFYGMLRLPILLLDGKTNVILSNMIAMELSAGSRTDLAVTSYVKFMKSLIMKAEDVKELREKGILDTCLANDEEVVKMFRELDTEGSCRIDMFRGVRERINEHCRSKTKTFKAELLYTYFRSPWTTIALFAAVLLLCINCFNFLLNYYRFTRQLKPRP